MNKNVEIIALSEGDDRVVLITPWSAVHYLAGVAAHEIGVPFNWWVGGHLLYELKDQIFNEIGKEHNSFLNSMADQAFATFGHLTPIKVGGMEFTVMFLIALLGGVVLEDAIG